MKREISTKTLLENKITIEHEGDGDTNFGWCISKIHKGLFKRQENLEIREQIGTIQITAF